ncbi:MAG TPA: 30S ribosomal protein S20 [Patescibacteria group bacterium]
MPVIKSAIKKVEVDIRRREHNLPLLTQIKSALKKAQDQGSLETVSLAYSLIDRAAKRNLIHSNKASRLKSKLGKFTFEKSKPKDAKTKKSVSKKKSS